MKSLSKLFALPLVMILLTGCKFKSLAAADNTPDDPYVENEDDEDNDGGGDDDDGGGDDDDGGFHFTPIDPNDLLGDAHIDPGLKNPGDWFEIEPDNDDIVNPGITDGWFDPNFWKKATVDVSRFVDDRPYLHYDAIYTGNYQPSPDPVFEFAYSEGSLNTVTSNCAATDVLRTLAIGNGRQRMVEMLENSDSRANAKFYKAGEGADQVLAVYYKKAGALPSSVAFTTNRHGALLFLEEYVTTRTGSVHTVINASYELVNLGIMS